LTGLPDAVSFIDLTSLHTILSFSHELLLTRQALGNELTGPITCFSPSPHTVGGEHHPGNRPTSSRIAPISLAIAVGIALTITAPRSFQFLVEK
jgi:hypothetical protein